jgi:glycosyltransferase involved in cell wall biosynthesis
MSPPRLCYLGPTVAPTFGGSALLFRLLQTYPADRLLLVEISTTDVPNPQAPNPPLAQTISLCRIPKFIRPHPRLRTLHDLTFLFARAFWAAQIIRRTRPFRPEAILCVIHGWLCEAALAAARRLHIPFHAVFHDHPSAALPAPRFMHEYRTRRWQQLCRSAASRLCVSPFMADEVQNISNSSAEILYPGLAPDADLDLEPGTPLPSGDSPSVRRGQAAPFTFSFSGTIHRGYRELILRLGAWLANHGHRLILHSPNADAIGAATTACSSPHHPAPGLIQGDLIPTTRLPQLLRSEADALFLPMSFDPHDAPNMRVSFPSKLVEYCAAARPVLIWGPPWSSAVRWAKQHPGFATIVDSNSDRALAQAVLDLLSHPEKRNQMAKHALQIARTHFTHEKTLATLMHALLQPHSMPARGLHPAAANHQPASQPG